MVILIKSKSSIVSGNILFENDRSSGDTPDLSGGPSNSSSTFSLTKIDFRGKSYNFPDVEGLHSIEIVTSYGILTIKNNGIYRFFYLCKYGYD